MKWQFLRFYRILKCGMPLIMIFMISAAFIPLCKPLKKKKKAVPPVTFSWYTSATALCKWDEVFVALNRWTITAYYTSPLHELLILCNFTLRNACLQNMTEIRLSNYFPKQKGRVWILCWSFFTESRSSIFEDTHRRFRRHKQASLGNLKAGAGWQ